MKYYYINLQDKKSIERILKRNVDDKYLKTLWGKKILEGKIDVV